VTIKGRTNPNMLSLIKELKVLSASQNVMIWSTLASELSKPNRKKPAVNLSHLNRISSSGDILVIPGKVLGSGEFKHKIEIAAESFSEKARAKLNNSGSQLFSIQELLTKYPKGSNIRIIK